MKRFNITIAIMILLLMAGCRTMEGSGAAAGAGTYPLDTEITGEETVLATQVDATKAGGFAIVRIAGSDMPISDAAQAALDLKQDASTAATDSELTDGLATKMDADPGGTVNQAIDGTGSLYTRPVDTDADGEPDYAEVARSVPGSGITGTVPESVIDADVARDAEVTSAVSGKFDTPTGTTDQQILGNGALAPRITDADRDGEADVAESVPASGLTGSMPPLSMTGVATLPPDTETTPVDGLRFYYTGGLWPTMGFYSDPTTYWLGIYVDSEPTTDRDQIYWDSALGKFVFDQPTGGVSIDDTATGAGHTDVTLSATEIDSRIATAITNAMNNLGYNTFYFAPNTTFPLYVSASPASVSFEVTDANTNYGIAQVLWQYDSGGYGTNTMTNTTGNTYTADVTISSEGSAYLQLQATDEKSGDPNSGESAGDTYAIILDETDPAIGTISSDPTTHDGAGTEITVSVSSITETNEERREYRIWNTTSDALEQAYQSFTGLSFSDTLPADTDSYRFDLLVTDLAGNTGTGSVAVDYSAAAACADSSCDGFGICGNFEGTGAPTGWTTVSTGITLDWDSTTSPLRGSESLRLQGSSDTASVVYYELSGAYDYDSATEIHFRHRINGSMPWASAFYTFCEFAFLKALIWNADGTLRCDGADGTTVYSADTMYHFWIYYIVDISRNYTIDVYVSTDATKPDTPEISTSGTGGYGIYRLQFTGQSNGTATYVYDYDQVLAHSSSRIGDVCE